MKTIKLVTYNVDGLPDTLDLKDLPLILRPISWIYKMIKGTTKIKINDDGNKVISSLNISKELAHMHADIIAVQEDFNYHTQLMTYLIGYASGTHSGGFYLNKIFSTVECVTKFPLLRFKADGLNIIFNNSKTTIIKEEIVPWKSSYGYLNHANDSLTHKGFRFYNLLYDNIELDIYNIHMDADFYNIDNNVKGDVKARKSQFNQLLSYITKRYNDGFINPIIIMGDSNLSDRREDLEIFNQFRNGILSNKTFFFREVKSNDVDKIWIINNSRSKYTILPVSSEYGKENNSDHKALIANISIYNQNKKYGTYNT